MNFDSNDPLHLALLGASFWSVWSLLGWLASGRNRLSTHSDSEVACVRHRIDLLRPRSLPGLPNVGLATGERCRPHGPFRRFL